VKELDEIYVIDKSYKSELKEKGSRFLSFAFPVENEEEVFSRLKGLKKEFYDASHHCYAFKLLTNSKYSDSGEPGGTAGLRILNAIEHFNLINILVVVVRYFGGTKLGVGRLGKAYYDSAYQVLEKSKIKRKNLYQKIFIKVSFPFIEKIYHLFNDMDKKILNSHYQDLAEFECLVKPTEYEQIIQNLNNLTNGQVEIRVGEKIYY
jgi:uncharacterized YigZ family protein